VVQVLDHLRVPQVEVDEHAARRALREQITRLERQLSEALASGFPHTALEVGVPARGGPRLLGLPDLETVRDDLVDRLHAARAALAEQGRRQAEARALLERMLAEPGRYRFVRIPNRDLGEHGCGVWQVRPRLGLIGMLMGWWQVKLSSGCPPAGRGEPAIRPPTLSLAHGSPQPQAHGGLRLPRLRLPPSGRLAPGHAGATEAADRDPAQDALRGPSAGALG
jgi:hypothetical protein